MVKLIDKLLLGSKQRMIIIHLHGKLQSQIHYQVTQFNIQKPT